MNAEKGQSGGAEKRRFERVPINLDGYLGVGDAQIGRIVAWLEDAGLSAQVVPQRTTLSETGTAALAGSSDRPPVAPPVGRTE